MRSEHYPESKCLSYSKNHLWNYIKKRKMKPLATNQRLLTWLYLCPATELSDKKTKFARIARILLILSSNLIVIASSVTFVVKFSSIDLAGCLYSLSQLTFCASVTYAIITTFFLRHKLSHLFKSISNIHDTCKNFFPQFFCN